MTGKATDYCPLSALSPGTIVNHSYRLLITATIEAVVHVPNCDAVTETTVETGETHGDEEY